MSRKRPFSYYNTQSQGTDYEGSSQGVVVSVKGKSGTKGNGLLGKKRMLANRRALVATITKTLRASAEHKFISYKTQQTLVGGAGNDINLMLNPTTMAQSQGSGQGDRVGDSIRIVKAVVKGIYFPSAYGGASNPAPKPMEVRTLFMTNRQSPQSSPTLDNMFQAGDASYGAVGTLQDMVGDLNRDVNLNYGEFYSKVGNSIEGPAAQGGDATRAFHSNNDFKYNVKFRKDVTKYFPKVIRFNDNSTTPQEKYVWMRSLIANADNTVPGVATDPMRLQMEIVITYIDV